MVERKRKLYLISLDAVGSKDLTILKQLPNFKRFFKEAVVCDSVESVYPSLTYPAHTTMVTGKYPIHHGIVNNTRIQPKYAKPDWCSKRKWIKGTTLYDELIQRGYTVAALLWPVTGDSKIQYNLPEIHPNRFWEKQVVTTLLQGSAKYILGLVPFLKVLDGKTKQPGLDNFVHLSAMHTIQNYNPDVCMVHYLDVDSNRHAHGMYGEKMDEAFARMDKRFGELLTLIEEKNKDEEAIIWVFGDHYQKDTHTIVYPNKILEQKGYLTTVKDRIKDYKVLAKHCDGACYLYLNEKEKKDKKHRERLEQEIIQLFRNLSEDSAYGIARVIPKEEVIKLKADGECICMLEAKEGYYFLDECEVLTRRVNDEKLHKMKATHGYLPTDPNYETFFAVKGSGIKKGARVEHATLADEGVTLAHLMGVDLGTVDGRVMDEMCLE